VLDYDGLLIILWVQELGQHSQYSDLATRLQAGWIRNHGLIPQHRQEILLFSKVSRSSLGLTQLGIQWVMWLLPWG